MKFRLLMRLTLAGLGLLVTASAALSLLHGYSATYSESLHDDVKRLQKRTKYLLANLPEATEKEIQRRGVNRLVKETEKAMEMMDEVDDIDKKITRINKKIKAINEFASKATRGGWLNYIGVCTLFYLIHCIPILLISLKEPQKADHPRIYASMSACAVCLLIGLILIGINPYARLAGDPFGASGMVMMHLEAFLYITLPLITFFWLRRHLLKKQIA